MATFPQDLDLRNSTHLLFEVGSIMTMLFGGLFLLSFLLISVLSWLNIWLQPGIILSAVFALLTIDGVIALLLSAHSHPQQPTEEPDPGAS